MHKALSTIPVFYRPDVVALDASTSSPSAAKPAQVVADWQAQRLPIQLVDFEPVDADTLALAHDRVYVREVLAGKAANGFGNRKPQVTASLPYTTGSMVAAARAALDNGLVACAPVECHGRDDQAVEGAEASALAEPGRPAARLRPRRHRGGCAARCQAAAGWSWRSWPPIR